MTETKIIVILDQSYSMERKKYEVIDGFNTFIDKQKEIKNDNPHFYLIKFNHEIEVMHQDVELNKIPYLTNETYVPAGFTKLYDAIYKGIKLVETNITDNKRVIFVIITDGEDNSSTKTYYEIINLIQIHESMKNWTFIYIGDHPDWWSRRTGIDPNHSHRYDHDCPKESFRTLGKDVTDSRSQ